MGAWLSKVEADKCELEETGFKSTKSLKKSPERGLLFSLESTVMTF